MKEILLIMVAAFTVVILGMGVVFHWVEVRPCHEYGELMGLEAKYASRCYVKREGVWIQKFYNDSFEADKLDKTK